MALGWLIDSLRSRLADAARNPPPVWISGGAGLQH